MNGTDAGIRCESASTVGCGKYSCPGWGQARRINMNIIGYDGLLQPLKADPFGEAAEMRPATASVISGGTAFTWHDGAHMEAHAHGTPWREPISCYEVHLGSWQRGPDNRFLTYDELADRLIPYAVELGFTHLELMPITEHPLDDSWGYQPIGMFAPTRRFGDPAGFARFVDRAHQAGLGVILDWVPAHFPTDKHGLAVFDGTHLYEHQDPRRGFHPDWNTAIYNFGRKEVVELPACQRVVLAAWNTTWTVCAWMPWLRCYIWITHAPRMPGCRTRMAATIIERPPRSCAN